MDRALDFGSPAAIVAILLLLVALVLVVRRIGRARQQRSPPPAPVSEPVPAETDVAFLDSSHIIDAPIIGSGSGSARREPPRDSGGTGPR